MVVADRCSSPAARASALPPPLLPAFLTENCWSTTLSTYQIEKRRPALPTALPPALSAVLRAGDASDPQLPSLFNSLRIAETLSQQQQQQQAAAAAAAAADASGMPPSAFTGAVSRSGSLQVPLSRGGGGPGAGALGAMSPPHVVFADSMQQARSFQASY